MIVLVTSMVGTICGMPKIPFHFTGLPKFLVDKIPDTVTALGFRVLLGMADIHDHSRMIAQSVSNEKMMERTGLNRRGLARGRQQLVEAGLIEATQQDENRNSSRWNYRYRPEILVPIGEAAEVRPDGPSREESPKQIDQTVEQMDEVVQRSDKMVSLQKALNSGKSVAATLVSEPEKEDDSETIRISDNKSVLESLASETISSTPDLPEPAGAGSVVGNKLKVDELVDRMVDLAEVKANEGEINLENWKLLAHEVLSPHLPEAGQQFLESYSELDVSREWFTRLSGSSQHLREI